MAEEILAEMEGKTPVPGPACPKCGREMRFQGEYEKQIESRAGEMEYGCGYYACHLGEPEAFGQKVRTEAQRWRFRQALETEVVSRKRSLQRREPIIQGLVYNIHR